MLIPDNLMIDDEFSMPIEQSLSKGSYFKYLDYLVLSEQNKQYLVSILFKLYMPYLNKVNTPMASKILEALDKALVHYELYILEERDIRGALSHINACIILDVKRDISVKPCKVGYDPLWAQKGPNFKKEIINIDTKQGSRWPIDQTKKKNFEMDVRFRSSKMYWNRPNFTKNYYGTDGK
jgi:hypothetical protein